MLLFASVEYGQGVAVADTDDFPLNSIGLGGRANGQCCRQQSA